MSDAIINSRLDAEEDSKQILSAAETLQNREIHEDCSSNLTVQRESASAYNLSRGKLERRGMYAITLWFCFYPTVILDRKIIIPAACIIFCIFPFSRIFAGSAFHKGEKLMLN